MSEIILDFNNTAAGHTETTSGDGTVFHSLGDLVESNVAGPATPIVANLKNTAGVATGISFFQTTTGGTNPGFSGPVGPYTGDAAWMEIQPVNDLGLRYWATGLGEQRVFGFGNLDPSKTYRVEGYSGRDTTGSRLTDWVIGAVTRTIEAVGNTTTTAIFTGLSGDADNRIIITVDEGGGDSTFGYAGALRLVEESTGPSITNIDGGTTFTPGASVVMNGSDFSTTGGSLTIGGVAQTITNRTATAITFTAVRGGNPYDQNLTLTYTDASSNTAALTVQQVAGANEDAVTAANPNTVDEASLWTGLVDTSTGNPITIVDGDQALLKDVNALGNLTATPAGEISANTEGNFVVQIRLASEGIWGSDQTVTFSEPDTTAPAITSVSVPASATYAIGQALNFTANWAESVDIGGVPAINFTIGGQARQANYASGTGTAASLFSCTVQEGDEGGISVTSLTLDGGTIRDAALNDANLTLNAVGNTSGITVDGVRPVVSVNSASTSNTTPTITGDAGDATSLTLVVTGIGTYNPIPSGGTWSQQLPLSAVGDYPMTLNGQDAAGNAAIQSAATLSIVEAIVKGNFRIGFKRSAKRPIKGSIKEAIKS